MSYYEIEEIFNKNLEYKINVKITTNTFLKKIDEHISSIKKDASIPGFRKNKIPNNIYKKKFCDNNFIYKFKKQLSEDSLQEIIEEKNLKIIGSNKINIKTTDEDNLEYEAIINIMPKMPEINFNEIEIENFICDISDKDINNEINTIAKNYHSFVEKKNKVAELDDCVEINFTGKINNKLFKGGSAKNTKVIIGSGKFLKDFEEGLLGTKANDNKKIKVKFPEDYGNTELRNKEAIFDIEILQVSQKDATASIEDIFKHNDINIESLKQNIKDQLHKNAHNISQALLLNELNQKLAKILNFEIPKFLLNSNENTAPKEEKAESLEVETTKQETQPLPETKNNLEQIDKNKNSIRIQLFLMNYAEYNNIQVTQNEITDYIESYIANSGEHYDKIAKILYNNQYILENFYKQILQKKTALFLLDQIKKTNKTIEFTKLQTLSSNIKHNLV